MIRSFFVEGVKRQFVAVEVLKLNKTFTRDTELLHDCTGFKDRDGG